MTISRSFIAGAAWAAAYVGVVVLLTSLNVMYLPSPSVHATEVTGTSQQLLSAASASGASASVGAGFMPRCRETVVYIQWGAGVGSGAVTVESAHDVNYTGTWAPLAVVNWTAANKDDIVQITGVHSAIRTRISTVLSGGTVSSWLACN